MLILSKEALVCPDALGTAKSKITFCPNDSRLRRRMNSPATSIRGAGLMAYVITCTASGLPSSPVFACTTQPNHSAKDDLSLLYHLIRLQNLTTGTGLWDNKNSGAFLKHRYMVYRIQYLQSMRTSACRRRRAVPRIMAAHTYHIRPLMYSVSFSLS